MDRKVNPAFIRFFLSDDFAVTVKNAVPHRLVRVLIDKIDLEVNSCVFSVYGRGDLQPRCAVIFKLKMRLGHADNAHVTVKTAVKCKVRHLRIDRIVFAVVADDDKKTFGFE